MGRASLTGGGLDSRAPAVIVGVGNTICGDDGVGPAVARRVRELLPDPSAWDVIELCCSPMEVVEQLSGYRRAVVVDALVDWDAPVGTVFRVALAGEDADLSPPSHGLGLTNALALARAAGLPFPEQLLVYGIVVKGPLVFGEGLSDELRARVDTIACSIALELSA